MLLSIESFQVSYRSMQLFFIRLIEGLFEALEALGSGSLIDILVA